MADWQNWIAGLSRYERDQLYPGMHKDLIPAYEMIEAQEERKIAQFGPFVQNEGPNFDKNLPGTLVLQGQCTQKHIAVILELLQAIRKPIPHHNSCELKKYC